MPARSAPTARQRRIGVELRKMREQAGLTVAQAALRLGTDRTRISNTESGRLGVRGDRVRTFATLYECADRAYVDALADMAETRVKGWWEEYRSTLSAGLLDLAELEHHASRLYSAQMMHVPGLLQTEDYIKALFNTDAPRPTAKDLRRWLAFRVRRREVLETSPQCTFLLHEAALRLEYGGPSVMRAQIDHILEASERENLAVRVIPFSAGGFPSAGHSVLLASGSVPQLDTVQLDVPSGIDLVDAPAPLVKYRELLCRTEQLALNSDETRTFLHSLVRET